MSVRPELSGRFVLDADTTGAAAIQPLLVIAYLSAMRGCAAFELHEPSKSQGAVRRGSAIESQG